MEVLLDFKIAWVVLNSLFERKKYHIEQKEAAGADIRFQNSARIV